MSAARHIVLTEEEASAIASLLLKLAGSPVVDEPAKPVVREPDPDRRAKIRAKVVKHLKRQGKL